MKKKKKFIAYVLINCIFCFSFCFGQNSDFLKGEDLFRQNKPEEAIPFLVKAVKDGADSKAYIYLALAYYQTKNYNEALAVCNEGMNVPDANQKIIAYNAGNIAFSMGNYSDAEQWYTIAIAADEVYASPVLNRANARLRAGKYGESREDYIKYLELAPDTEQRPQIEKIIGLIDVEVERMQRENPAQALIIQTGNGGIGGLGGVGTSQAAARQAEADRLAREEEERKRRLLEDVAASLQGTTTENMSAGAEGTVGYGYESELE